MGLKSKITEFRIDRTTFSFIEVEDRHDIPLYYGGIKNDDCSKTEQTTCGFPRSRRRSNLQHQKPIN